MKGKVKPYNSQWNASSDMLARNFAKDLFYKTYKCKAMNSPCKYGIDMVICTLDEMEIIAYCEVEIKRYLDFFDFDSLHILERKKKFFTHPSSKPVIFCLFSTTGKVCAITTGDCILDLEPEEVKNNAMNSGEYFYKVPLSRVMFLRINEGGTYEEFEVNS